MTRLSPRLSAAHGEEEVSRLSWRRALVRGVVRAQRTGVDPAISERVRRKIDDKVRGRPARQARYAVARVPGTPDVQLVWRRRTFISTSGTDPWACSSQYMLVRF